MSKSALKAALLIAAAIQIASAQSPATIVTESPLPHGVVSRSISIPLTASGGNGFYVWFTTLQPGQSLPPGLSVDSGGSVFGVPTTAGTYTFRITVDSSGSQAFRDFQMTIYTPLSITTTGIPAARRNTPYSTTLAATGGAPPYTWVLNEGSGSLPDGLTLDADTGVISGTPTGVAGVYNINVVVFDSVREFSGGRSLDLVVGEQLLAITTPATLPQGAVSSSYSLGLSAAGGNGNYFWSQPSGTVPPGLSLSSGGSLSGTPTTAGTYTFTARVDDTSLRDPQFATRVFTIVINPLLTITTTSLPGGQRGTAYVGAQLASTGGLPPIGWTVSSGSLPPGLTLSSAGAISGTPTAAGTFTFTVLADDSGTGQGGQQRTATLSITIANAAVDITSQTTLPVGAVNNPYTTTLTATGGNGTYLWSVLSGSLPAGVTLSSGGVLSGTPTAAGTFTFVGQVTDSSGGEPPSDSATFTLVINPLLTISTTTLPDGQRAASYSAQLVSTGGQAPVTWSISAGSLPPGLTLSSGGAISGTPTTPGAYPFTVLADDSGTGQAGQQRTAALSITITNFSLTITTSGTLPPGAVNNPYTTSLTATGGNGTYLWSVQSGALPAGITLASGGTLSGTPTAAGTFTFVGRVTDTTASDPPSATATFTLVINPLLTITTSTLPDGQRAAAYTAQLASTGGQAPVTWSVQTGSLPPGLTLSSGGAISGTPTAPGVYPFTVLADDSAAGQAAQQRTASLSITISNFSLTITSSTTLPTGAVNNPYTTSLTATGGNGTYLWSVQSGALPAGITLASGGTLSGTPTASGTFTFVGRVTDTSAIDPPSATATFTLVINPLLTITTTTLPDGQRAAAYTAQLVSTGGQAPITWSISAGSLPPGLTLSSGGAISGTPTTPGAYPFTVLADDSGTGQAGQQRTAALSITITNFSLTITTSGTLPPGAVNNLYTTSLAATGGNGTYLWSVQSGALPAGITLASGGTLSGTPTAAGTFTFVGRVTDTTPTDPPSATATFTLVINPLLTITTTTLPDGQRAAAYTAQLVSTGGQAPITWSVQTGSLPPGLTLSSGGAISGTPTTPGAYSFTVLADDSGTGQAGQQRTAALSITITNFSLTITTSGTLPPGAVNNPYTTSLAATGGNGTYLWSVQSGALPAGITLASGGTLSGTPTAAGTFTFVGRVTDTTPTDPPSATATFTLVINPLLTITTTTLPDGQRAAAYTAQLVSTGGQAPITWSISAGSLPPGLTLSSGGAISGTPTTPGAYPFTVLADDSGTGQAGQQRTAALSITITNFSLTITTSGTLPPGAVNNPYTTSLAATGGNGTYLWSVQSGTLPAGITLASGGTLSGTPTAAGTFTFVGRVTDTSVVEPPFATATFTLVINPVLTITTTALPDGQRGIAYIGAQLASTGGLTPVTWSVQTGSLPPGLALSSAGAISGTPTAPGTYTFTVLADDAATGAASQQRTASLSITITNFTLSITTQSTLPQGIVNAPYSTGLTATGGNGTYIWTVQSGSLPPGITLASGGTLSGTPTTAGTFTFVGRVEDTSVEPPFATSPFTLVVNPVLTITTTTLPGGQLGTAYVGQLASTGGLSPITWSVSAGSLPPGLTLTSAGALSGTPTTPGVYPFTVLADDSATGSASQQRTAALSITVADYPLTITTADPINAVINTPFSLSFATTGGAAPYTYSISSGSLPAGFTLTSAGLLSGTSAVVTASSFVLSVLDGNSLRGQRSYMLSVNPRDLLISTTSPLPVATQGTAYATTIQATGGTTPYLFRIESGTLPPGLFLAPNGGISGTPTQAGPFTFTVAVDDSSERSANRVFTLRVNTAAPLITTTSLPNGSVSVPYAPQTLQATEGLPPFAWSVSEGSLPPGLTLSSAGVIQGTPSVVGTYPVTFRVTGANNVSAVAPLSITIDPPILTITTTSPLPPATRFAPYTASLAATGGVLPYTWSLDVESDPLPPGLSIDSAGVISGTPTTVGVFTFSVRVQDSRIGNQSSASQEFTITVEENLPVITTASLPAAMQGALYATQLVATGGNTPYTFSLVSGSLPPGFQLSSAGEIRGTTLEADGLATFAVRVTDANGRFSSRSLSIQIIPRAFVPVQILTSSLPEGSVGRIYGVTLTPGFGEAPFSWGISGLPPGLEANSQGEIIGVPTRAGTYQVQATVTDAARGRDTRTYNLVIRPGNIVISNERLTDGRVGEPYAVSFAATGGIAPYGFSVAGGTLPPGLGFNPQGQLVGTPTQLGVFGFSVQASDTAGGRGSKDFTLTILPSRLTITTERLSDGALGVAYSGGLAAVGGRPPYQWSVSGLPAGLSADASTGAISGTPTSLGTFSVTAQARDSANESASRTYTLVITGALSISTTSVSFAVGSPASGSLGATGGLPPYSWSITGGSLPAGVGLGADGAFSGTPTATGPFSFTAQVRDQANQAVTRTFSGTVATQLTITTQSLSAGISGVAYSATLGATGGTPPYQWSSTGTLPPGLSVTADGAVTGTPTATGTFGFSVIVRDSAAPQQVAQRAFSIVIGLPQISNVDVAVPANPQPQQQSNITVSLDQTFPVDIAGTLTLTFTPNAANNADDPFIQFSTGGRSVPFTIPAGQTIGVFAVPNLGLQLGTTAGTITITTNLTAGGNPVSCNCQLTRTVVIPRSGPVISSVRVQRTAGGFTVTLVGFSTIREVTQGTFQFAGTNLQTNEVTVPLSPSFNAWFQGSQSTQFGGQFTLTLPFTIQGDLNAVTSVTVSLTNSAGTSQAATASF